MAKINKTILVECSSCGKEFCYIGSLVDSKVLECFAEEDTKLYCSKECWENNDIKEENKDA